MWNASVAQEKSNFANTDSHGSEAIRSTTQSRAIAIPRGTLQAMMAELQKQSAENLATIAKQQYDAMQVLVHGTKIISGGMTDTRGIGRPMTYKGEEDKCSEWKAKLMAYVRISAPRSDEWILWISRPTTPTKDEDVDLV